MRDDGVGNSFTPSSLDITSGTLFSFAVRDTGSLGILVGGHAREPRALDSYRAYEEPGGSNGDPAR